MTPVADNPNAVRVLMRLVGVGLAGLTLWMAWLSLIEASDQWRSSGPPDTIFITVLLAGLVTAFLAGLGCLAGTMIWVPRRTHVVICTLVAAYMTYASVDMWLEGVVAVAFQPAAQNAIHVAANWATFILLIVIGLTVEWQFSKAAGFIDRREPWWQCGNIRGFFRFSAVLLFFGLSHVARMLESESSQIVRSDYATVFHAGSVLIIIVYCIFHATWLPTLVMHLTGVTPEPEPPRSRRGFRLW